MDSSKVVKIFIVLTLFFVLYNNFYNNNDYMYGECENFTDEPPSGCELNKDYTSDSNMICRMWYIRNVLGLELFDDNHISQDAFIDSLFSYDKILMPLYTRPFGKINDVIDSQTTVRVAKHIVNSVNHLHKFMSHTFYQLKDIIDTNNKTFDPYIATCSTQITLASILFEFYRTISNSFFTDVSKNTNPSKDVSLTLLYLMPLMMYLKNHITTLMESAMIVLNKEKTSLIDISSINENVYVSLHSQLYNETNNVLSVEVKHIKQNSCEDKKYKSYDDYNYIVTNALKNTLQLCQDKIQTIKSLTSGNNSVQTLINADLIHIYYRAFNYFKAIYEDYWELGNIQDDNMYNIIKYYEWKTRSVLKNTQPIPFFTEKEKQSSIHTPINTFKSTNALRQEMIAITKKMDSSLRTELTKYTTPGTIGSLFMQLLNSRSEILSMPINLAQASILKYINSLPENYLSKVRSNFNKKTERFEDEENETFEDEENETFETFENNEAEEGGNENFKNFCRQKQSMIGNCMKKCLKKTKQQYLSYSSIDLFDDNINKGYSSKFYKDSNGKVVYDSNNKEIVRNGAPNNPGYDTTQQFLIDKTGKVVLDSTKKPVLSTDYLNSIYVPVLDNAYPQLQSQEGIRGLRDIRGTIPVTIDIPPPIGLPGRPNN